MEETGKRRIVIAFAFFVGLVYFFVCAPPLPRELGIEPVWSRKIEVASGELPAMPGYAENGAGAVHSFRLGATFGYFDEGGKAIVSANVPFNVAVSDDAYMVYDREPAALTMKTPDGRVSARISEPGYPFFGGGRTFVMHPGQTSVAEIGKDGRAVWSRDFTSIVTAFDARPGLALFGLMDGRLVGIAPDGAVLLDFAPGGSRIEGVYGCAVSPDGSMAAAICGLDKQRLVVLEKRSAAYRVAWHRWLESDFRRPVSMAFTEDGAHLLYESPSGLGIYATGSRTETSVSSRALSGIGLSSPGRGILLAVEGSGPEKNLLCASAGGKRLFSLPFSGEASFASIAADAVFLGASSADGSARLLRLDFKEE